MTSLQDHTRLVVIVLTVFLACSQAGRAKEAAPEKAIVTAVQGDVTYSRPGGPAGQPLVPFLQLEAGDTLTLPDNSSVTVLFIQRGLGETWHGPKILLFQDDRLLARSRGEWLKQRPNLLKTLVFEPQNVLSDLALWGASRPTREIPAKAAAIMEENYGVLREEFGEDDVTPDLYRLNLLSLYGQYDRMADLLRQRLEEGENPVLRDLLQWVESRRAQP